MPANTPAIRKRQQIESAGKIMFLWVAGAAAVLGIAVVLSISLLQRIDFKQRVINEKAKTVSTLDANIKVVDQLKTNVRVLNSNDALLQTPRLEGSEPLSVILDALPSTPNSSALGASLQQKLLTADGVTIESLVVDPIAGVENDGEDTSAASTTASSSNSITFAFTISVGDNQDAKLQEVLKNIERSIRAINIKSVSIEQQSAGGKITMSVTGEAYYQPATSVELKDKSCTPGKGC